MENEKLIKISRDLKATEWILHLSNLGAEIYLVGGIVRDAFLEKESKDIDLVIEHLSLVTIKSHLKKFGKVIENIVGDSFKVLKFRPMGWTGELFDIATPRKDIKTCYGHRGFLAIPVKSIKEDLRRRDFTINSMAFNINSEKLIDPFRGRKDLRKGLIKATNKRSFVEDPLRLMRAISFASRFEFDIEAGTKRLMKTHASKIKEITGERILEELIKIINKSGNTQVALDLLIETDLDSGLLGSKLHIENLGPLDDLSFLYILCSTSHLAPKWFYMNRLKGDKSLGKELEILDSLLKLNMNNISSEELRYKVFMAVKRAPKIGRSLLLPIEIDEVLIRMRNNLIPATSNDIQITGTDVEKILGIKGGRVGFILNVLLRDSLMNRVDWRNREKMLAELKNY